MAVLDRLALAVLSVIFLIVGVTGWASPDALFAPLGATFSDAAAYAEIRAAYGGHFVGAASFFAWGAWRPRWAGPALIFAAVVLGGFVFGRLISLVVDGVPSAVAWLTLGAESFGLVVTVGLSLANRRTRAP
jgi:hypothetical protein